jgi:hypothetical protein
MVQEATQFHPARARERARRLPALTILGLALACLLLGSNATAQAAKPVKPACADRVDNDGDGRADYDRRGGGDPDCLSRTDRSEATCGDDDGDGAIDETGVLPHVSSINCIGSQPAIQACEIHYWDLNAIVTDGCEYGPVPFTGPETCDALDNDADGSVDEGVVLPEVPHGMLVCDGGSVRLICEPDYSDVNGDPADGCEYTPPPPIGPEECDGLDNDQDGAVDEDLTFPVVANGAISCENGHVTLLCEPGFADFNNDRSDGCEGEIPIDPRVEQCDGLDNDGDEVIDEGVVFPSVANGELVCHEGSPQVLCHPGFEPVSSDPYDGCRAAAGARSAREARS